MMHLEAHFTDPTGTTYTTTVTAHNKKAAVIAARLDVRNTHNVVGDLKYTGGFATKV